MASIKGREAGGARVGPADRARGVAGEAASRLRAENAALHDRVARLEASLAATQTNDVGPSEAARLKEENEALRERIAESRALMDEVEALRAELAEALRRSEDRRQDSRALDREIVEMRGVLVEAERQLANVRQTFIYRIGDAIVAARTWKGVRSLPRRLYGLRRAYLQKRGMAGSAVQQRRLAERLRYVERAREVLAAKGLDAAVAHVRSLPVKHVEERARALVELAMAVRAEQPVRAAALGVEAAKLNGLEPRLRPLALALFDQGEVKAPAQVLAAMAEGLMVRPADLARRETILAQERQLDAPLVFPRPSGERHAGEKRLAVVSPVSRPTHADAESWRAQAVIDAACESGTATVLVTAPAYQYPASGDGEPVSARVGQTEVVRLGPPAAAPDAFDAFVAETGSILATLYRRRAVSHVYALAGSPLASAALWGARRAGARFILDIGAIPAFGEGGGETRGSSERFRAGFSLFADTARAADAVIVRSSALARELAGCGIAEGAIVVDDALPPGFARSSASSVRDVRLELSLGDRPLVGVVEPLDGDEGLADAVRALPAVRASYPDATVLFCGPGRGGQALRRLAAQLGVADHVIVSPIPPGRSAVDQLSAFTVAAFLKRRAHAAGLVAPFDLQAALAVGAPVVAADNAWSRDWIVDQQTGLSTAPGDVEALSRAILRCLDEKGLAQRLGRAGVACVRARSRRAIIDPQILATLDGAAGRAAA